MLKSLIVATRAGRLAIAQTQTVIAALRTIYPDVQIEIKRITTAGDRDRRTALWQLEDSGFFTSGVEDVLLSGKADFAVHSFKDLPTGQPEALTIAAVLDRRFPEDCLVAAKPTGNLSNLPHAAKVGTSSLRRAAQIKYLRPDLQPVSIRGNILTRLRHLETGKVDAVVLARAGLERIGLGERISFCFDPGLFLPAPAQGALAVQVRKDNSDSCALIAAIDDDKARVTCFAERQVLVKMQCGCHAPVGAFAQYMGDAVTINAFIADVQGTVLIKRQLTGPAAHAMTLADQIAAELLDAGGREILQSQNT
jgi:hydroxymethylbilane synthase